jgi:hypothetical protein
MRGLRLLAVVALLAACAACSETGKTTTGTTASAPAGTGTKGGGTTVSGAGAGVGEGGGGGGGQRTGTGLTAMPVWIITSHAVDLLRGGLTNQQLAKLFNNQNTYLVGPTVPGFTSAHRTASTPTTASGVPSGTDALLYDVEAWSMTPKEQQLDPAEYEAANHAFAQAHQLVFLATPATDLVNVLDLHGTGTAQDRYLKLGIIADAARNADVVDIQAQSLEGSAGYADFVTKAAAQAKAANPKVIVLAGLSTNPSSHAVDAKTFADDANSVRTVVDGYWLNVPEAGDACPRCGAPQPQVAYPWLKSLLGA